VVSKRPSFIVRTRYKICNRGLRRDWFHWSKWHTVHTANTQEEAFEVVAQLMADPTCEVDDILVSHYGRRVNDKVHFDKPAPAKIVTQSALLTDSSGA